MGIINAPLPGSNIAHFGRAVTDGSDFYTWSIKYCQGAEIRSNYRLMIRLYSPVRFGSVLPGYVGFLRASPRVFSCLVQSYTHPSGDNYGDRYVWLSLLV